MKTQENTELARVVSTTISHLKRPIESFYINKKEEVILIASEPLSKETRDKAYKKRQELARKRIDSVKLSKEKANEIKDYINQFKDVEGFIIDQSKPLEDQLQAIEDKWKDKVTEELNVIRDTRIEELEALGETVFPEGLAKMSKMEFKILVKSTEEKIKLKFIEAEYRAEMERAAKEEAAKLKADREAEALRFEQAKEVFKELDNSLKPVEETKTEGLPGDVSYMLHVEIPEDEDIAASGDSEKTGSIPPVYDANGEQNPVIPKEGSSIYDDDGTISSNRVITSPAQLIEDLEQAPLEVAEPVSAQEALLAWVTSFELPDIDTEGFETGDIYFVEMVQQRFREFKSKLI